MKRLLKLFLMVLFCYLAIGASSEKWNISKSTHFIVHYKAAKEDFVNQVIDQAEKHYEGIAEDLGFRRYNFWLWDNRAKIYIYNDAKDFQVSTGQPEWSSGSANVRDKVIQTYPYARSFFDSVLPHEMGHIIFREFISFDNPASPIWLDEGVASYQEKIRLVFANRMVRKSITDKKMIPLDKLSAISPQDLKDKDEVSLFYSESVSVVNYLVKEFGTDDFVTFCQKLRDKRDFIEALSSVYGFKSMEELNNHWIDYLAGK